MNTSDVNKKYKRPRQKTLLTTNPETSKLNNKNEVEKKSLEPLCPLLAKDSEWVDILQTPVESSTKSSGSVSDEEEILQLVECEEGPEMKPLAIMFPGLLEKDPQTLQGVLNKAMSTTEVTKHLVDLGQKANFTFMKKANRLIPRDKQWLERLTENSNSHCSIESGLLSSNISSDYEADSEIADGDDVKSNKIRKKKENSVTGYEPLESSTDTIKENDTKTNQENIATLKTEGNSFNTDVAKSDYNYDADTETIISSNENIKR